MQYFGAIFWQKNMDNCDSAEDWHSCRKPWRAHVIASVKIQGLLKLTKITCDCHSDHPPPPPKKKRSPVPLPGGKGMSPSSSNSASDNTDFCDLRERRLGDLARRSSEEALSEASTLLWWSRMEALLWADTPRTASVVSPPTDCNRGAQTVTEGHRL